MLERRRVHGERQAALRNGTRQRADERRRRPLPVRPPRFARKPRRFVAFALFRRAASRRGIAAPCFHAQSRPRDAHFDLVEPAVALMIRRIVAEQVVAAVGVGDALKRRFDVVGVDRRETSGLLGKLAERVLRRSEFLQQFILDVEHAAGRAGDAADGRVRARHQQHRTGSADSVADACRFHEVGRHPRQPTRIDCVVIDVGARRCRDRILRRANHDGGIVRAEHVADGKVEPFAEEQHGFAPAAHAAQKLRRVLQRVEDGQRAGAALELRGIRRPPVARRILRVDRSGIWVRVVPQV